MTGTCTGFIVGVGFIGVRQQILITDTSDKIKEQEIWTHLKRLDQDEDFSILRKPMGVKLFTSFQIFSKNSRDPADTTFHGHPEPENLLRKAQQMEKKKKKHLFTKKSLLRLFVYTNRKLYSLTPEKEEHLD